MKQELLVYRYARKHATTAGDRCEGSLARIVPNGAAPPPLAVKDYCDECLSVVEMDRREPVIVMIR